MVRKPEFPFQQIIRRLSEQVFIEKDAISYPVLKGAHMDGPLLDSLINGDQFKNDYIKARKKLSDAEFTSDIQTEAEEIEDGKRKKRPNRRYVESSDESEEEPPPKRKSPRINQAKRPEPSVLQPPMLPIPSEEMQQAARDITPPLPSLQSTCTSSMMESTSSKTSAFEVKLLTTLEKVRSQVLQNTKLLQLVLEKVEVPDESSALEQLPVEVKELRSIGGENMKTTVRRVLSHMIGKELATKINWVGKGDKIPFKKPETTQRFDRFCDKKQIYVCSN
uniref:DUF4806 domain-containing protein n=1 Tax=Magallana gigas TaxID=29159 RepID=A0A8W8K393_MAGGI